MKLHTILKQLLVEGREVEIAEPKKDTDTDIKPEEQSNPNPLAPPKTAPKTEPKGLFEDDLINKIVDRYQKLKERRLTEASIEQLQTQFVDTNKITQETFNEIKNATLGKSAYTTWLTSLVVGKTIKRGGETKVVDKVVKEEDVYKFKSWLSIFDKYKKYFPKKDINQIKTPQDLQVFKDTAIAIEEKLGQQNAKDQPATSEESSTLVSNQGILELNKVGIKLLGTEDGYQIFEIPQSANDDQAFKTYVKYLADCSGRDKGAKIEICTMANPRYYKQYLAQGPYYVIFNKKDPKSPYQFHYESSQFMDKDDNSII